MYVRFVNFLSFIVLYSVWRCRLCFHFITFVLFACSVCFRWSDCPTAHSFNRLRVICSHLIFHSSSVVAVVVRTSFYRQFIIINSQECMCRTPIYVIRLNAFSNVFYRVRIFMRGEYTWKYIKSIFDTMRNNHNLCVCVVFVTSAAASQCEKEPTHFANKPNGANQENRLSKTLFDGSFYGPNKNIWNSDLQTGS